MEAIVCKDCGYISIDGTTPAACPVCGSTRFEQRADELHQAGDVTKFSEPEKKHVPAITIRKACSLAGCASGDCIDVHVAIGAVTHPMLAEHFIRSIDFYLNKTFVARVELRPDKIYPAAEIHLKAAQGTVTVIERCNIHGAWIAEHQL